MAWRALCPACAGGRHSEHVRDWNITPGLIGGAWCYCEGEPGCTQRFEKAAERMLREMGLLPPSASGTTGAEGRIGQGEGR